MRVKVNLALVEYDTGNVETAKNILIDVLPLCVEIDDMEAQGTVINNIAAIAIKQEDPTEARKWIIKGLALAKSLKHTLLKLNLLENCSRIEILRGYPERSAFLLGAADTIRNKLEYTRDEEDQKDHVEQMKKLKELLGEKSFRDTLSIGSHMNIDMAIIYALEEPDNV